MKAAFQISKEDGMQTANNLFLPHQVGDLSIKKKKDFKKEPVSGPIGQAYHQQS